MASEIPRDIEKAAREVCRKVEAMPSDGNAFIVADEIWRRVLIERERCAKIAQHRLNLARTVTLEAAGALFVALPDAIRQDNPNETEQENG